MKGLSNAALWDFVSYAKDDGTGAWRTVEPMPGWAISEEEATRAAALLADFIYAEMKAEVLVRITRPEGGHIVGEIRRPISN